MTPQDSERARWRRGEAAAPDQPRYPLEQEYSLELPLGYACEPVAAPPRIAVLLHAFHLDLLAEFRAYLDHLPYPADLFVTTDDAAKQRAVAACFSGYRQGAVETLVVPNRGRDIAPKLVGLGAVHDRYDYVLHLHTKRSVHESRLVGWRGYLLETLLGSPETVRGVFEAFAHSPWLGLLAPQHIDDLRPWVRWSTNFEDAEALALRMGFPLPRRAPLDFPSGSMFWARSAALRPLLDLRLEFADFPEESGQTDGTLAHAIERLYFLVCERAGFDWMKIAARGALHDARGVTAVDTPQALGRFLSRRRVRLAAMRDEVRAVEDFPIFTTLPPMPRRLPHVLWARALGDGLAATGRLAVTPLVADERLVGSLRAALLRLPSGADGEIVETPPPIAGHGDGARRNHALRAGFASGADLVLLLDEPGVLHPDCAAALLRMSQAQDGRALLEVARFPQPSPKSVDPESFAVAAADGPGIAVPCAVFEATGGFDAALTGRDALVDFSRRARALGLPVRHCPRALYLTAGVEADAVREQGGVDVVVRLSDTSELPRLGQCVFALAGQSLPELRLHVMLQRFSWAEMQETRATIQAAGWLDGAPGVTLHNWEYPEPFELGVPLLNWGLELARGRYFTCLGVNDLPLSGAFARLLHRLRATSAGLAVGAMAIQPVRWWGDVVLPLPDAPGGASQDSASPLFLLDRARVPAREIAFRANGSGGEVADFVERIGNAAEADRRWLTEPLGLRQVPERSAVPGGGG